MVDAYLSAVMDEVARKLDEIEQELAADRTDGRFRILYTEATIWLSSVDERLLRNVDVLGYSSRLTGRDGALLPGLRLMRNAMLHHHGAELADVRSFYSDEPGYLFYFSNPRVWGPVERLPKGVRDRNPALIAPYREHLEGKSILDTLRRVHTRTLDELER